VLALSMILFSVAVSLDGFGVGFAYGMRNIRIPFFPLIVICLTSSTAIAVSMVSGKMLTYFIPVRTAHLMGALILAFMGLFMFFQAWLQSKDSSGNQAEKERMLFNFRIPFLGILIQILKEPSKADLDKSGIISIRESFVLGFALAMDALGAGFAVAVAGFPPFWTAVSVGGCKFILVSTAVRLGKISSRNWLGRKTSFVPGLVLLILGLSKLK